MTVLGRGDGSWDPPLSMMRLIGPTSCRSCSDNYSYPWVPEHIPSASWRHLSAEHFPNVWLFRSFCPPFSKMSPEPWRWWHISPIWRWSCYHHLFSVLTAVHCIEKLVWQSLGKKCWSVGINRAEMVLLLAVIYSLSVASHFFTQIPHQLKNSFQYMDSYVLISICLKHPLLFIRSSERWSGGPVLQACKSFSPIPARVVSCALPACMVSELSSGESSVHSEFCLPLASLALSSVVFFAFWAVCLVCFFCCCC